MSANILIVEDEEKLARFVELELLHEGYKVSKCGNGRDAYEEAVRTQYDLILLDIMLPGLSGIEVLRRLMKERPTPVPRSSFCATWTSARNTKRESRTYRRRLMIWQASRAGSGAFILRRSS